VLRRDPAGAYARMDFLSRDAQRHAVEELAPASGDRQMLVALKAIESARQAAAAGSMADRRAHVGYHLVDRGRAGLEADLAHRPSVATRTRRFLTRHATFVYLGATIIVTALIISAADAYAMNAGAALAMRVLVALLVLLPASDFAIASLQYAVVHAIGPKRLPRLDFVARSDEDADDPAGHRRRNLLLAVGTGAGVCRAPRTAAVHDDRRGAAAQERQHLSGSGPRRERHTNAIVRRLGEQQGQAVLSTRLDVNERDLAVDVHAEAVAAAGALDRHGTGTSVHFDLERQRRASCRAACVHALADVREDAPAASARSTVYSAAAIARWRSSRASNTLKD